MGYDRLWPMAGIEKKMVEKIRKNQEKLRQAEFVFK